MSFHHGALIESLCIKLLTIYTFVATVYWCALNFLTFKRNTGARKLGSAGTLSTSHRKKPNKETTEVYDPLYKKCSYRKLE